PQPPRAADRVGRRQPHPEVETHGLGPPAERVEAHRLERGIDRGGLQELDAVEAMSPGELERRLGGETPRRDRVVIETDPRSHRSNPPNLPAAGRGPGWPPQSDPPRRRHPSLGPRSRGGLAFPVYFSEARPAPPDALGSS